MAYSEPTGDSLFASLAHRAERQKDDPKNRSLENLAPILTVAFSHLNNLSLRSDPALTEPFAIHIVREEDKLFPRRIFKTPNTQTHAATFIEQEPEQLPVFSMEVVMGSRFNVVTDLPRLTAEVQRKHNEMMREYGQETPMVFLDTNKQLAEYWHFMGKQMRSFAESRHQNFAKIVDPLTGDPVGTTIIEPAFAAYADLCTLMGDGFLQADAETHSELAEYVSSEKLFEREWRRMRADILYLVEKVQLKVSISGGWINQRMGHFLQRAVAQIGLIAQEDMLETLNTQSREAFFQHCQAELYRKAGLARFIDRMPANEDATSLISQRKQSSESVDGSLATWIKNNFPKEHDKLHDLKEEIQNSERVIAELSEPDAMNEKEKLASLQLKLAEALCAVIYSQKLFVYDADSYSFSSATEKNFVNCMIRGDILYQLWKEFAGGIVLGALSQGHYFVLVELADGSLLSLDGVPLPFAKSSKTQAIGAHSVLYQAALYDWKAISLADEGSYYQAEILMREACRLEPKNLDYKYHLAMVLSFVPDKYIEAAQLLKRLVELNPKDPDYNNALAILLKKQKKYSQSEQYYRAAIAIDQDNFDYVFNLANLLGEQPKRWSEAEKLYKNLRKLYLNDKELKKRLVTLLKKQGKHTEAKKLLGSS